MSGPAAEISFISGFDSDHARSFLLLRQTATEKQVPTDISGRPLSRSLSWVLAELLVRKGFYDFPIVCDSLHRSQEKAHSLPCVSRFI